MNGHCLATPLTLNWEKLQRLKSSKFGDEITPLCIPKLISTPGLEIQRLTGRPLIEKLVLVNHAKFVFLQTVCKKVK